MIQPILHQLNAIRVILASGSPRRHELLRNIGLNAEICPSKFEENLDPKDFQSMAEFVEETALQKVLEVSNRIANNSDLSPALIIGADTMVVLDDQIYGKPKTPEVAFKMLSELVGKSHNVYTGVVIKHGNEIRKFTEKSTVHFGKATSTQIQAYVDTGEPLDKAGGYGIQGVGGTLVEKIDGDFFNIMGLPMYRLSIELCKLFNYEIE